MAGTDEQTSVKIPLVIQEKPYDGQWLRSLIVYGGDYVRHYTHGGYLIQEGWFERIDIDGEVGVASLVLLGQNGKEINVHVLDGTPGSWLFTHDRLEIVTEIEI